MPLPLALLSQRADAASSHSGTASLSGAKGPGQERHWDFPGTSGSGTLEVVSWVFVGETHRQEEGGFHFPGSLPPPQAIPRPALLVSDVTLFL